MLFFLPMYRYKIRKEQIGKPFTIICNGKQNIQRRFILTWQKSAKPFGYAPCPGLERQLIPCFVHYGGDKTGSIKRRIRRLNFPAKVQ